MGTADHVTARFAPGTPETPYRHPRHHPGPWHRSTRVHHEQQRSRGPNLRGRCHRKPARHSGKSFFDQSSVREPVDAARCRVSAGYCVGLRSGRSRVRIAAGAPAARTSRVTLFFAGYGRSGAIRARFGIFVWIPCLPTASFSAPEHAGGPVPCQRVAGSSTTSVAPQVRRIPATATFQTNTARRSC